MKQNKDLFTTGTRQNRQPNHITIDVSLCAKLDIDIDDLFVLYAQHTNQKELINLILSEKKYKESINKLQFGNLSDGVHCLVSQIFGNFKTQFEELWKTYPNETPNGRKLKGYKEATEKKYIKYLNKNPNNHSNVILCLNRELDARNKNGSVEFMTTIIKWVESHGWEYYMDNESVPEITQFNSKPDSNILL